MKRLLRPFRARLASSHAFFERVNNRLTGVSFIAVLVVLLGGGMIGVLLLNTQIQNQQQSLDDLQTTAQQLQYHEAALAQDVDQLGTTNVLAAKAANLGMVPNPNPVVIKMPAGTIYGNPTPAVGNEMPGIAVPSAIGSPTPSASPSPAAANSPVGTPANTPTGGH